MESTVFIDKILPVLTTMDEVDGLIEACFIIDKVNQTKE